MPWDEKEIAAHVASEIEDGWVVNLGIGVPTLVVSHLQSRRVVAHSENGILGMGPPPPAGQEDPDLVDAGKQPVTVLPGAAFIDSLSSFGLIRGGHLDLAVIGAYQVSPGGDLANWRLPGRRVGGIGGAADLAAGARQVWVAMTHTTKQGEPKLVPSCTYPLTARGVVTRIFTDLGVFEPAASGFAIRALAPGVTVDQVRTATDAPVLDQYPTTKTNAGRRVHHSA